MATSPDPLPDVSRRKFFSRSAAVAGAGGLALGAAGAAAVAATAAAAPLSDVELMAERGHLSYPFYGEHQSGIETPPQDHLVFTAFEVTATTATELQLLLAKWSAAMAELTAGNPVGKVEPSREHGIPVDTGEATDMGPQGLTLTLGFGPSLFDSRFGLEKFKPVDFADLPAMAGESLNPAFTGGDLCIQACSNDPQVAYHAVRNLARIARASVTTKWTVLGFGRASAGANQTTPRNLMGFKDGTRNVLGGDELAEHVWVGDEAGQAWMAGGSYLVARKIHMLIETWDEDTIGDQHSIFGRTKKEGAPLSGEKEHDTPDFHAVADGAPVIPADSHIALVAHENNGGTKILRRGYNFTDGLDSVGRLDAGLFFLSFQKNPEHFVALQRKLGASDRLNEYIRHVGSGVFAVPGGLPAAGSYYGKEFFD
ncbi:iron uptake transporter deferrochelatase/peroxidase subunit [Arthrobacter sp. H35-D1]|uniref:iron uptake transporter deferrochelatase/peroxidase subunit n=1 Tax=Arthrobacter sp. H35-D1 TaxID=3046202 RepID=UPI0024BB67DB|nr:iron uptake transporter deferrochelatase/peroxidase subunit [Arthrobacter sp. H35-D1]MDJ0314225.1 iron uptake transporter deferrochelatase/peroxidase subunit [Arthrobacter sp. H35-D1]